MRIKCNLAELLKKKNKTLYWLDKNTSISYTTLNLYEKDRAKRYDSVVLAKLCKALNCNVSELLVFVENED